MEAKRNVNAKHSFETFRSYINECIQIHNGHTESIIEDRFLHVSNDQHDIHLQFGRQLSPVHFAVQTVGHACKTIGTDFPEVTENEEIDQGHGGEADCEEYVRVKIMDLLENGKNIGSLAQAEYLTQIF